MVKRALVVLALALATLAGCEEGITYPPPELPGSCSSGQRACYRHPIDGREILLECNDGAVKGAIWLVDHVCAEGELCESSKCVPVS